MSIFRDGQENYAYLHRFKGFFTHALSQMIHSLGTQSVYAARWGCRMWAESLFIFVKNQVSAHTLHPSRLTGRKACL